MMLFIVSKAARQCFGIELILYLFVPVKIYGIAMWNS
ncbi:hypothetical protein AT5A_13207 [Agrobacterium tumefaciens 5A]|nr:hypothetical protein AT5A_13207 [Agrobacterium tumefaciens 5A]